MSLWPTAAGSTTFETEVLFLRPRGCPGLVVCLESLPACSTNRLFWLKAGGASIVIVLFDDPAEHDKNTSIHGNTTTANAASEP